MRSAIRRLPSTTSSTRSSTVPGHTKRWLITMCFWPIRHARVTGLVFDRGVPPSVVQHHVIRGGEIEAGAAGLQAQHERAGAFTVWKSATILSRTGTRQTAVVAVDGHAGRLAEVLGEAHAPLREVGEHEHALPRREHGFDDLLEPQRACPDRPSSGRSSRLYADGWLQICLSAVMAARIWPLRGSAPSGRSAASTSSSRTAW